MTCRFYSESLAAVATRVKPAEIPVARLRLPSKTLVPSLVDSAACRPALQLRSISDFLMVPGDLL